MSAELPALYAAIQYASASGQPRLAISIAAAAHGFLRGQDQYDQAIARPAEVHGGVSHVHCAGAHPRQSRSVKEVTWAHVPAGRK